MNRTLNLVAVVAGALLVPALAFADEPTATAPPAPPPPPAHEPVETGIIVINPPPAPQPLPVLPPQPEGEYVTDVWNGPEFVTGALVFAGTYGASAIVAGTSEHVGADRLYYPVLGPWLALNDWGTCPDADPHCQTSTSDKVLLIGDGIFQAAGVVAMIDSLFQPTRHRVVRNTTAGRELHITPKHNGIGIWGRF